MSSFVVFRADTIREAIDFITNSKSGEYFAWLTPGCDLSVPEETEARIHALGDVVIVSGVPPRGAVGHCNTLLTALHIVHRHCGGDWGLAFSHNLLNEVQKDCNHYIFKEAA